MENTIDKTRHTAFIITLTGPSMSGKTYVMEKIEQESFRLRSEGIDFNPVRVEKFTTRAYRLEEIKQMRSNSAVDVRSVAQIPIECDLIYRTYGMDYGVSLETLKNLLNQNKTPVIVVNDVRVVEEIKSKFKGRVLSLFLFRKIPELKDFKSTSNLRGNVNRNEVKKRFEKAVAIYRTYIENITLFNRVILNVKDYSGEIGEIDFTGLQIHNIIKGVLSNRILLERSNKDKKKKMFIISGSAASGKDEIIRAVEKLGKIQAFILPKYTTRIQEPDDGKEMICKYVPKESILSALEEDYKREYEQIRSMIIPDESFANNCFEKYSLDKLQCDSFEEYLEVQWEANRLKKLKEIYSASQRFWLMVENKRKLLSKQKKSPEEINSIIVSNYFQTNPNYIPIEKLFEINKEYFEEYTRHQEIGVSGPACLVKDGNEEYIIYKNNKDIIYAFKLTDHKGRSLQEAMASENRHSVIAASLTEIFKICREQLSNEVVTVFAYSQISAENYKKHTHEGTATAKANEFTKDIERYSKYIEYFDHVSIYAESVYGNKEGGAEEELIDQIFRLFRAYN